MQTQTAEHTGSRVRRKDTKSGGMATLRSAAYGLFFWWRPLPKRPYWLWLFAAGAVLFHVICFYWMRPFESHAQQQPQAAPALAVYLDPASPQSATLAEQSSLLDFEPLFLPTAWNAEPQRISVFDRSKRTEPFELYGAEISTLFSVIPDAVSPVLPQSAQEAVELGANSIFSTFGRTAAESIALSGRQGQVQIESLSVLRPQVSRDVPQQTIEGLDGQILGLGTFLIEVDATGSVTLPLLRRSTGQEAADRLWGDYLYRNAAGWGLQPGTYLLTVGP